jgi:hypothetical protein
MPIRQGCSFKNARRNDVHSIKLDSCTAKSGREVVGIVPAGR